MSPDQFKDWCEKNYCLLKNFVVKLLIERRLSPNRAIDVAQDITQESLARLVPRAEQIRSETVNRYALRSLQHTMAGWFRKAIPRQQHERRYAEQAEQWVDAEVVILPEEKKLLDQRRMAVAKMLRKCFHHCFETLSDKERSALLAWYEYGGDRERAAPQYALRERLGVADLKTVLSRYSQSLHRGQEKLQELWENVQFQAKEIALGIDVAELSRIRDGTLREVVEVWLDRQPSTDIAEQVEQID